jgi:hypothetical protein
MTAMSGVKIDSGTMAMIWIVVLTVVVVSILPRIAQRKRRRKCIDRPIVEESLFYGTHYPNDAMVQDIARKIHTAIAEDIKKVDPTQILPSDRMNGDLSVNVWWGTTDWDLEHTLGCVEELIINHISPDHLEYTLDSLVNGTRCTVRDLVTRVVHIMLRTEAQKK